MDDTRVRIVEWSCYDVSFGAIAGAVYGKVRESKSPCEDAKHVQVMAQTNGGNWLVTRPATELVVRGGHSRGNTKIHQVWDCDTR